MLEPQGNTIHQIQNHNHDKQYHEHYPYDTNEWTPFW